MTIMASPQILIIVKHQCLVTQRMTRPRVMDHKTHMGGDRCASGSCGKLDENSLLVNSNLRTEKT